MTHATLGHEPRQGYFSDSARVEAFMELYAKTFALRHVADLSPSNEAAHDTVRQLIEFVRGIDEAEAAQILHPKSDVLKKRAEVCKIIARAEYDTAMFFAPNIRSCDLHDFGRSLMFRDYVQQIENEASVCPVSRMVVKNDARVAIIGAGPMPLEAIYIFETTGKMVTCLDADKSAVESGREVFSQLGYSKAIQYHHASLDMYGIDNHPYVIVNNAMINNFRMWETLSVGFFAEFIANRSGNGIYATIYEPLSPQLAEMMRINFLHNRSVEGTPATMQNTHYADLNASPESAAKMAIGGGREGFQYALHRLQEEQNRPGSMYLMPRDSRMSIN